MKSQRNLDSRASTHFNAYHKDIIIEAIASFLNELTLRCLASFDLPVKHNC